MSRLQGICNVLGSDGALPLRCSVCRPDTMMTCTEGKMKAIQVRTTGGREALELCELPDPVPNKDEVLVRVSISGVNFIDVYYREGKYKAPLQFSPGPAG